MSLPCRLGINGVKRMRAAYNSGSPLRGVLGLPDERPASGWRLARCDRVRSPRHRRHLLLVPGVVLFLFGYSLLFGSW